MAASSCRRARRHCLGDFFRNTTDIDINCRSFSFFETSTGSYLLNASASTASSTVPPLSNSPNDAKIAGSPCHRERYRRLERVIRNTICIDINCRGFSFFVFPDLGVFRLKCLILDPASFKKKKSVLLFSFSFLGRAPRPKTCLRS